MDKFVIKKPKNANRRIVIRTTDEMAEEIFSVAQEMNVSVNTFITNCIQFALDHRWLGSFNLPLLLPFFVYIYYILLSSK